MNKLLTFDLTFQIINIVRALGPDIWCILKNNLVFKTILSSKIIAVISTNFNFPKENYIAAVPQTF